MVIWVIKTILYSSSVYSCHLFFKSSPLLLGPYHFCPLLSPFLHGMFPWYLLFPCRDLQSLPFCYFLLFLCIDCWGRLSYLSLLFFGTLHSNAISFFFSFAFHFSASSDSLLRRPFCLFAFLFLGDSLTTAPCTRLGISIHSSSGTPSIIVNFLILFVTSSV